MRIAIYNRWLHTLGGGERDTALFAQVLQDDHEVDLLTHQPIDIGLFAQRLNRQLGNTGVRALPFDPNYEHIINASADYDIFINMSHGDMFIPRSQHRLMRVFFPAQPAEPITSLNTSPQSALDLVSGFYQPETASGRTFAWTGSHAQARLVAPPSRMSRWLPMHIQLIVHGWRPAGYDPVKLCVFANGIHLGERLLPIDGRWIDWRIKLPNELINVPALTVSLETPVFNPSPGGISGENRDLGVAVAALRIRPRTWHSQDQMSGIPTEEHYRVMQRRQIQPSAAAYDQLLANSRFTQSWIERRWQLPSQIVYPPVEIDSPGDKQQTIVSVGRFFQGSHNKKHLPMIAAFRALCDGGLQGWEYHLVGGCDEAQPKHRAYLQEVRDAAAGYPITFHVNAPFETVRDLYRTGTIFWHATGFGEDEERNPELFEHLGITTVEAMARGCIPIVFGRAGQLEIVDHGVEGFLWYTLAELQTQTRRVIEDAQLRARLAEAALHRSREFAPDSFTHNVRTIIDSLR